MNRLLRGSLRLAVARRPTRHVTVFSRKLATVSDDVEESGMAPPLQGMKVLDFTSALSGPSASQYLGDLGAEVWKLEMPGKGDDTRHWGPPFKEHAPDAPEAYSSLDFESSYFGTVNRNKLSITVNVRNPEGLEIGRRLAAKADIVLENLITGKLDQMGLGYDALKKINPGIIYCSISGYGRSGPYRTAPGYDAIVAGDAGIIHCTGEADRLPVRPQVAISDHTAGYSAYVAILASIISRKRTGLGSHIEISMFDCQVAGLANAASQWLNLGIEYQRTGTESPWAAPYQVFATSDSSISLAITSDEQFLAFAKAFDTPELARDVRFAAAADRLANKDDLADLLSAKFAEKHSAYWMEKLMGKNFPFGCVNNLAQTCTHPQVKARNLVADVPHAYVGSVRLIEPPVMYSGQRMKTRLPPPALGQHTVSILTDELGYSSEKIADLKACGAI